MRRRWSPVVCVAGRRAPSDHGDRRTLLGDLKRLVEPATMGDPMRPLTWVSKSREKLAAN